MLLHLVAPSYLPHYTERVQPLVVPHFDRMLPAVLRSLDAPGSAADLANFARVFGHLLAHVKAGYRETMNTVQYTSTKDMLILVLIWCL